MELLLPKRFWLEWKYAVIKPVFFPYFVLLLVSLALLIPFDSSTKAPPTLLEQHSIKPRKDSTEGERKKEGLFRERKTQSDPSMGWEERQSSWRRLLQLQIKYPVLICSGECQKKKRKRKKDFVLVGVYISTSLYMCRYMYTCVLCTVSWFPLL